MPHRDDATFPSNVVVHNPSSLLSPTEPDIMPHPVFLRQTLAVANGGDLMRRASGLRGCRAGKGLALSGDRTRSVCPIIHTRLSGRRLGKRTGSAKHDRGFPETYPHSSRDPSHDGAHIKRIP